MNTIIRNGRIIDPANGRDEVGDIAIVDGCIANLSAIPARNASQSDAGGPV